MAESARTPHIDRILALEVPIVVRLGVRTLRVSEVTALVLGSIIELPKNADTELELMVNNRVVGTGLAVKVGENFGIRISTIGDQAERVAALGESAAA
jgi:flagellar motor switch protein FliN/FliY